MCKDTDRLDPPNQEETKIAYDKPSYETQGVRESTTVERINSAIRRAEDNVGRIHKLQRLKYLISKNPEVLEMFELLKSEGYLY